MWRRVIDRGLDREELEAGRLDWAEFIQAVDRLLAPEPPASADAPTSDIQEIRA